MIFYDFEKNVDCFMYAYMYELEIELRNQSTALHNISFQSDEANTDRPLKEFMKSFIATNINKLPESKLSTKLNVIIDNKPISFKYSEFSNIYIDKVLLPEELSNKLKLQISESKSSVYTNPDLFLMLTDGTNSTYRPIELKSTKSNAIPGSSIQQIVPNEWVVFVKHNNSTVEIATGQYIHSINSRLQFPDRSPRPQVAFNELSIWNNVNRISQGNIVTYSVNVYDEKLKYDLINDWQSYLADRWVEVLFTYTSKSNEPWFNNNLRKFIINFLDKYENLNEKDKTEFKNNVKSLIKKRK